VINLNNLFSVFRDKKKVGLALGGGVARGIAHIGVLKVLTENNIPIDFLSGTSSGSLIGALFAAGMSPSSLEKAATRLGWFRFVRIVFKKHGAASTDEIKRFIIKNIGNVKFSELNIPFGVVAADLLTGKEVFIKEGNVADAVAASCAFPGVFCPIKSGSHLLVDGGLYNNVPSSVVKSMGADFVIAVDVVPGGVLENEPENALQIFGRALDIVQKKISEEGRSLADLLIEPKIPENIWHIDFDKAKKLIAVGEEAAQNRLLEIKARLFL